MDRCVSLSSIPLLALTLPIVFTKCADNLENGRRLENLSWRLWYRECQLLEHDKISAVTQGIDLSATTIMTQGTTTDDLHPPALSNSVESASSDAEFVERSYTRSSARQLSKAQHLTPNRFHELVTQFGQEQSQYQGWRHQCDSQQQEIVAIEEGTIIIDKPRELENSPVVENSEAQDCLGLPNESQRQISVKTKFEAPITTPPDVQSLRRASSVVHGFHPDCISVKKSSLTEVLDDANQNRNMFFLESSPSESDVEEESSSTKHKRKSAGRSLSGTRSLRPRSITPVQKHTSFRDIVDEGSGYDSSPFDSDSEEEMNILKAKTRTWGDSAIMSDDEDENDGDEADWDSVCTESRANSPSAGNFFNKVDGPEARPGLNSCKSILSTLLTNPMTRLSNDYSKSSPAIAQSRIPSPTDTPADLRSQVTAAGTRAPEKATPIKGAVSPRTIRRNMMATELSESLRRHLLWERKQKSSTSVSSANHTVLQRRHTAYDMSKIQTFPAPGVSLQSTQRTDMPCENEFGYNGAGW